MHLEEPLRMLKNLEQWDEPVGKHVCEPGHWSSVHGTHSGRRELTSQLSPDLYTCIMPCVHLHSHTHCKQIHTNNDK